MLSKNGIFFCFFNWVVGLLINVGAATAYASVERADLDLLFGLRTPWLGADVALSIRLNRSSYIWVWGDTLVGNLYANGHRNISSMVHDSFSIVNIEDNTTKFYIPNNTLGFLRPYRLSRKFTRTGYGVSSQIPYYWVVAGMLSQKLVFLCQKIEAVDVAPGFKQVATDVVVVDNFGEGQFVAPSTWVYKSKSIPYSNGNCTWNEGIVLGNEDGEVLAAGVGVGDEDAYVYIMGRCSWASQSGAALSRILHDDFLRFPYNENNTKFEYLATDGTWTAMFLVSKLKMLFPSVFSEGNLIYNKFLNSWYVLLCQAFDPVVHIALSNSKSLYKDTTWNVEDFYSIPPKFLNKAEQLITYASKSHPEYAPNGNDRFIVFSFNTNTLAVEKLGNLTYIYHPHFVQVDLMTHKLVSKYGHFIKDDAVENKHYSLRRRHMLSPIRDSIAAEMGVLPADHHHREAKGETGASSASVAPEAKKVPEKLSTQKKCIVMKRIM